MKKLVALCVLVCSAFLFSGCYLNEQVNRNEVAAMIDGGRITAVVGSGVYTNIGLFADLEHVACDVQTVVVNDDSVATKDTQVVSVEVTVQVGRGCDNDSVTELLSRWSSIAKDDQALVETVKTFVGTGIKEGTRAYTLDQLLDDRKGLAESIRNSLNEQIKFPAEITAVAVTNVDPNQSYIEILQEKANIAAQTSTELRRQELIRQKASNDKLQQDQDVVVAQAQLEAEKAKTAVQLEISNRAGQKIAAENQVYQLNQQAFELKRLELLANVLGDKTILLPSGNLNLLLGLDKVLPVPTQP